MNSQRRTRKAVVTPLTVDNMGDIGRSIASNARLLISCVKSMQYALHLVSHMSYRSSHSSYIHMHIITSPIPSKPFLRILHQLIRRPVLNRPVLLQHQCRIGMRIVRPAQTRIPLVIKLTVRDIQMPQEGPYLRIPPVQHRMDPHKFRPASVRHVKRSQFSAVRICTPGADENGFYVLAGAVEVFPEGIFHAG